MLSQLTYTTQFLPLFNIDNQRNNNSDQMFSAQWVEGLNFQPNTFNPDLHEVQSFGFLSVFST